MILSPFPNAEHVDSRVPDVFPSPSGLIVSFYDLLLWEILPSSPSLPVIYKVSAGGAQALSQEPVSPTEGGHLFPGATGDWKGST